MLTTAILTTRLYASDGPSEVALLAFYVSEKGTSKNFIALSNFINTNTKARHNKATARADKPPRGLGGNRGRADKWAEPTDVFSAMGDAGLIATLSPDELRPADESSLWSILYSVEKLAESAPPVGESAQAARKRKLARRTHDEGCDRIERHLDARAKAAKARAKGDADKGKDKGEDGEEDEDGEEEEGDDPQ